jgi:membrane protein required for colicin V production
MYVLFLFSEPPNLITIPQQHKNFLDRIGNAPVMVACNRFSRVIKAFRDGREPPAHRKCNLKEPACMMNPFDMVVVAILGYCLILGLFKGFIREAASIAGIVGGFWAAYAAHDSFAPLFSGLFDTPAYQAMAAFISIFIIVCLVANLLGLLLRFLLRVVLLGALDRFFGGLLGALKGVILVSLVFTLLITFLPIGGKQMVADSYLAPYANAVSKTLVRVVPEKRRRAFLFGMEELKKNWSAEASADVR